MRGALWVAVFFSVVCTVLLGYQALKPDDRVAELRFKRNQMVLDAHPKWPMTPQEQKRLMEGWVNDIDGVPFRFEVEEVRPPFVWEAFFLKYAPLASVVISLLALLYTLWKDGKKGVTA